MELKSAAYEKKLKHLQMRELMLCYQELQEAEEEKQNTELQIQSLEQNMSTLKERKEELDQRYSDAAERCRIAMNNDIFKGMQDSLNESLQTASAVPAAPLRIPLCRVLRRIPG